jgi:hypothetical protein
MAIAESNPKRGRTTLPRLRVGLLLLAAASPALAQEAPRRLPAPEIPLEVLKAQPESTASQPGAAEGIPYSGPPASIDGPERLPGALEIAPGEGLPPGITAEDLVPFADSPLGITPGEGFSEDYYVVPQQLTAYKSGFFQKLSLSAAWFGNSGDPEDLGATEIETFLTVALPAPIKEWPLLITPGYNVAYLAGPGVTDLPPRLHFAYVEFAWVPEFVHRYRFYLAVAPSVLSDFESNDADAFRVTGKGLVLFNWIPGVLELRAGVLYLNRDNIRLLPAGGVIWTPNDWMEYELFFPKPKASVRFNVGPGFEDWLFTTAEFGGNTWSIERASGEHDKVTYLDYRLLAGVERRLNGGAGFRLEAGYVFGRSIEFESGDGNFDPKSTVLIRGAIVF